MSDGPIRLACIVCDRSDYDGVDSLPLYWDEIVEIEADNDEGFAWWTHLGTCPECWDDQEEAANRPPSEES